MALPPTVPSSFVPYSNANTRRFRRMDFGGAFGFFAYGVFFLALLASVGVFLYGRVLAGQKSSDDAALAKAEAQLDPATVNGFLRLENRLKFGAKLLDQHVALSNFFAQLDTVMPQNVQLQSLSLAAGSGNSAGYTLRSAGVAASLNALAQFSNDLGAGGKIKNVIVSDIKVNQKDNSVSFSFTATLDPSLTVFSADAAAQAGSGIAPASTGSAATSTGTSSTASTTKS